MGDITAGKVFVSGETNIDDADMNAIVGGAVINPTFHTGKSSAGTSPAASTTEVMVYDTVSGAFKKGTLNQLVFDHSALLAGRSAKTTPVSGDVLLLADSESSNALRQITLKNLLFGMASWSTPVAGDKLAILDSSGNLAKTITLNDLIDGLVAHTAPVTADELMIREAGGAVRKITLGNLIHGASSVANPGAAHELAVYDGTNFKKVALSELISNLASTLTSPAGTELVQTLDGSLLKKLTLANLKTYVRNATAAPGDYILVIDQKPAGTPGGTFTSGSWEVRDIQTTVADTGSLITGLGASILGLTAGTYRVRISCPANNVTRHQARLYNLSDSAVELVGTSETTNAAGIVTRSLIEGRITIASAKGFSIEHRCSSTRATDGYGVAANFGEAETYTVAEFVKEA